MKRVLVLSALIIATAGFASADFGTLSLSSTAVPVVGAYQIDMTVTIDSAGATAPAPYDWMGVLGQIYYPYTWSPSHASFQATSTFVQSGRQTNGGTPFHRVWNYSPTAPVAIDGDWGAFSLIYYANSGATTWTGYQLSYVIDGHLTLPGVQQPTATQDPNAGGNPVPTMNRYGIIAMVVLLLGVAVLVISRRS